MPTAAPQPLPIPPPNVPVIYPRTGRVTKAWYDFLANQATVLRVVRSEIP